MKLYLIKQKAGPGMSKRMFDTVRSRTGIDINYDNLVIPLDY